MVQYQNKLRFHRQRKGMTQMELAQKFREPKDSTVISRWERGKVKPSAEHLMELSKILDVDPFDIYPLEEEVCQSN